jgi:hypothetical protein
MAAPTFGGYVALTTSTTSQNKTDINANLTRLLNLLPVEGPTQTTSPASPDFGVIPQSAASALRAEIVALQAVITASP